MYGVRQVFICALRLWRKILLVTTPLILLPLVTDIATSESKCAYVAILMGIFWTFEPIPLPVTALMPVVLFPMLGVLSTEATCDFYLQETSVLFIGTLIMAIAIEYSNLHRRIALKALCLIGTEIKRLMFGVMFISMFLAIWINNIATTAMMMPILDALSMELIGKRRHSRPSVEVHTPTDLQRINELSELRLQRRLSMMDKSSQETIGPTRRLSAHRVSLNPDDISAFNAVRRMSTHRASLIPDDISAFNAYRRMSTHRLSLEPGDAPLLSAVRRLSAPRFSLDAQDAATLNAIRRINSRQFTLEVQEAEKQIKRAERIRIILYLSVVYGANTGAIATITSAASNVVFKFVIEELYDDRAPVDYASWFLFSLPPTVFAVLICYAAVWAMYFWRGTPLPQQNNASAKEAMEGRYRELGPVRFHESGVLFLFLLLVFLWMFRDPQFARGWATYFGIMKPKDATAAMLIVILLFAVPSDPTDLTSPGLLTWPIVQDKLQWSVILLLGGGFALAEGTRVSGLSQWLGTQMIGLRFLSPGVLMMVLCLITSFISEFISNAGTVTILLPVFAALAEDLRINPLLLMIPATLCSNFAFLLPVGTPANTIVYEHIKMETKDMVGPGFVIKMITIFVTVGFTYILGGPIFDMFSFPAWVNPHVLIPSPTNITASLTSAAAAAML